MGLLNLTPGSGEQGVKSSLVCIWASVLPGCVTVGQSPECSELICLSGKTTVIKPAWSCFPKQVRSLVRLHVNVIF